MKRALYAVILVVAYGCATTAPAPQPAPPQNEHGLASWYGQEFAGRTTANGEIFDPMVMTAAHRTLPFGTIVDVTNPKTGQTVRVRINDRGPYINNRIIDLSYAAAAQIGLTDDGSGEVMLKVVKIGKGDREPPAPLTVSIPDNNAPATTAANEPPKIEFPLPSGAPAKPAPTPQPQPPTVTPAPVPAPVTVDKVQVTEQHGSVETRRQVAPGGKSVEVVPVKPGTSAPEVSAPGHSTAEGLDQATHPGIKVTETPRKTRTVVTPAPRPKGTGRYIVQVGAFSIEANAKILQERLKKIGEEAWIDHTSLYHVRLGPFETREQAIKARERLENAGISAIIVAGKS